MRVFGTDVDVALGRSDRDRGDRHPLDQHEGIALHDHAVGKGPAIALVGVADHVFLRRLGLGHGAPFDAGGESGAAAAAQARLHDLLDDRFSAGRKRAFESLVAAVRAIIGQRARIDHAAAGEGQARLPLEPGNVLGRAEPQLVRAVGEDGAEQSVGIARRNRSIGDPACRRLQLHHRLEPIKSARTGAHDFHRDLAPRRRSADRGRNLFGPDRQRPGVGRYEQPQRHCCASASSASSRVSSSRATTRPSSMADGASAHRPRQ